MLHIDVFRSQLPPKFLDHLSWTLVGAYERAFEFCQAAFSNPHVFINHVGYVRRGFIEQELSCVPSEFTNCVTVREIQNGPWWVQELGIGCATLSQARLQNSGKNVRKSIYRSDAAKMNQLTLCFSEDSDDLMNLHSVAAVLVHGGNERPTTAAIKVPSSIDHEGSVLSFYDGEIDLIKECRRYFEPRSAASQPAPVEFVEDAAFPQLINRAKTGT